MKQIKEQQEKPFIIDVEGKYEVDSLEDVMAIRPLGCIYCCDPHLSVLGLSPTGELIIICDSCRRLFALFDKGGEKIIINKSNNETNYIG